MSQERWYLGGDELSVDYWPPVNARPRTPSIVDGVEDLLALLDPRKRNGLIAWLSVRYYDGWRPGRQEIADLVAVELGVLTVDDYAQRKRQRRQSPATVTDITPLIMRTHSQSGVAKVRI